MTMAGERGIFGGSLAYDGRRFYVKLGLGVAVTVLWGMWCGLWDG